MNNRNFDRMTQNEKKQRFKKAVDDYDRGYLETDGEVLRTVISVRVEEALDDAGRTFDEFSENQKSLIFEAARENLNLEHYMNPDFSENHMKFIMEQEKAGRNVKWLPIGMNLHRDIAGNPLTDMQIEILKRRMLRAEKKESVIDDLNNKRNNIKKNPKTNNNAKEKGERKYGSTDQI